MRILARKIDPHKKIILLVLRTAIGDGILWLMIYFTIVPAIVFLFKDLFIIIQSGFSTLVSLIILESIALPK